MRDSSLHGTNVAVRLKSARTRGGGIEDVAYRNLTGTANAAVQISLQREPAFPRPRRLSRHVARYEHDEPRTNVSATPVIRDVSVSALDVDVSRGPEKEDAFLACLGLDDSPITGIAFDDVRVAGSDSATCAYCSGTAAGADPAPCFA